MNGNFQSTTDRSLFDALRQLRADPQKLAEVDKQMDAVDWTGGLEKIADILKTDPILLETLRKMISQEDAGRDFRVSSVSDVLGERLLLAYSIATGTCIPDERTKINGMELLKVRASLCFNLISAQPYLWSWEMWKLATEGDFPEHEISENQMPYPFLWYTFPTDMGLFDRADADEPIGTIMGMLLITVTSGMSRVTFYCNKDKEFRFMTETIPYGVTYPKDIPLGSLESAKAILGSLAFINSPYVMSEPRGLRRQERKRFSVSRDHEVKVNFVDLRRAAMKSGAEANGIMDVDWSCRWKVSPHRRNQWYPSTQSHKLIWIPAYIKGPEDKPLKQTVYRVVR